MYLKKEPYVVITYECNRNCNYCYAIGLKEKFKKEISMGDFSKLAAWLSTQGVKAVGLLGGEPTIHSKFTKIIETLEEHGLYATISTNGLFGKEKRKGFESSSMKLVTLHVDEKKDYSKENYSALEDNAEFLSKQHFDLSVRYVIHSKQFNLEELLKLCSKHNLKDIRFGIATPGTLGKNDHPLLDEVKQVLPLALKAIEKSKASGFNSALTTLLPTCLFKDQNPPLPLSDETPQGQCCVNERGEFDPSILIQPDLSFNVCLKLPISEKNIFAFKNLDDAKAAFKERFLKLQSAPLMKKCRKCSYFTEKKCQGGCLVYKLLEPA